MTTELKKAMETISKCAASCKTGDRYIVVLDRGWIFAGNLQYDDLTKIYALTDCINIENFKNGGFGGLTKSAKAVQAKLTSCDPIKFHARAMIFAVPITEDWDA